jgi:hypothetical protein
MQPDLQKRIPKALLLIFMLTALVMWGQQQEAALASHRLMWSQDLAFFNQILFNAAHGESWTSSLLLEPTGFFSMVHFHPVLAAILPIYWLRPGPSTLLWINVLAVVASAWPLARIGARATDSEHFGLAAGLAWLVWLPTQSAAIADFRPMVFLIPALSWLIWGVYAQRRALWIGGVILCCAAREESAYILPSIGLLLAAGLPLGGKRRKEGLLIACSGLAWLVFLLIFKDNFFFHFNPTSFFSGESGPAPSPELTAHRWRFLGQSIGSGYFGALLSPAPLAFSIGPLSWLMTDAQREWHAFSGTVVYLKDPLLPLIASAGTLGAAWVVNRWEKSLYVVCCFLVLGNFFAFHSDQKRLNQRHADHKQQLNESDHTALQTLLERVKPEDRVATDYTLIATLSGREVLWNRAHLYLESSDKPPHWTSDWPIKFDRFDTVVLPEKDSLLVHMDENWKQEAQGGTYALWRRTAPPTGGFPKPLP